MRRCGSQRLRRWDQDRLRPDARSVTCSRPIVGVVLVRLAVLVALGRLCGPGKLALQRVEIGVMGVVLQLPGHLLLLGFRTAAPHGSTPSLHGRPGGSPLSGKVGHRRIASVPRSEKHVHPLRWHVEVASNTGSSRIGRAAPMAHSGQRNCHMSEILALECILGS